MSRLTTSLLWRRMHEQRENGQPQGPAPDTGNAAGERSGKSRMAVYAGTFDPPTLAHIEIIETALKLFDRVTVIVAFNPSKPQQRVFTPEERVSMLKESLHEAWREYVEVRAYGGLVAPYAERLGACALVRGMRPVTDPDYEISLSLMNAKLAPSLPTVLLTGRADHMYLSSTFVRDTAQLDGLIVPGTVPPPVEEALRRKFRRVAERDAGSARRPATHHD